MLATAGVTPVMARVYAARETGRSGSGAKFEGVWMVPSTLRWKPQKRAPKKR